MDTLGTVNWSGGMNWSSFLFVLLAACANVVGGLMLVLKQNWSRRGLHALMALSAGLLMAIAILDFIPDSLEHESSSPVYILLGVLAVYFFQHEIGMWITQDCG